MDNLLILLYSPLFAISGYFISSLIGTVSHPAVVFFWFWSALLFSASIFMPLETPVNFFSVLYIYACIFSFALPTLVFTKIHYSKGIASFRSRNNHISNIRLALESSLIVKAIPALSVISLVSIICSISVKGFQSILMENWINFSSTYASMRGHGDTRAETNIFDQLAYTSAYLSAALGGGVNISKLSLKNRLFIQISACFPGFFLAIVLSQKLAIFSTISFFASSAIISALVHPKPSFYKPFVLSKEIC